jgi:hypothetical protein
MKRTPIALMAAAVLAVSLSPVSSASLPPGDYNFTVLGSEPIPPVHVVECGFECITLTSDSGFKVDLTVNRRGDRYEGRIVSPAGVVCDDKKAHRAETSYTVNVDGTEGRVEVIGQPCQEGVPVVPLVFSLTTVA